MTEMCVCEHDKDSHPDDGCVVSDCFCPFFLGQALVYGGTWHGISLGPDDSEPDTNDSPDNE